MRMEMRNQKSNQLKKAGIKICVSIMATFALLMSENTFGAVTQDPGSNSEPKSCGSSSTIDPGNGAGFGPLIDGDSAPTGTQDPLYCSEAERLKQDVADLEAAVCSLRDQRDNSIRRENERHREALLACRAKPTPQEQRACIEAENDTHHANEKAIKENLKTWRNDLAMKTAELKRLKMQLKNYCKRPEAQGCDACLDYQR